MDFFNIDLRLLVLTIPAILLAITVHEVAHGLVAYRLGDPTAKLAGRLTLNPLAHLDPIGALMMVLVRFGWAKPVPVNPANLQRPLKDMIWVALAGPAANMVLAAASLVIYRYVRGAGPAFLSDPITGMAYMSYVLNINLAAFNLIPIPPLDGASILKGLLPFRQALAFQRLEPYGFVILVVFLMTGMVTRVFYPLITLLDYGLHLLLTPIL